MSADAVLVWGATSQARVLKPILEAAGHVIGGFYDDDAEVTAIEEASPLLLADRPALQRWVVEQHVPRFVVAIGGDRGRTRCEIGALLRQWGLVPARAIHPAASIAPSAEIADDAQILRAATISEKAIIGSAVIINTAASIDHDCVLAEGVHVMPGAVLTGRVTVERYATIGANATVLPNLRIGEGAMIGAGAVVTRDIPPNAVALGVPARARNRN